MSTKRFFQVVMEQGLPKVVERKEMEDEEKTKSDGPVDDTLICPQCGAELKLEVED